MPFVPSFQLHCDKIRSQFTLTKEGQNWRQTFESFEEAYEYAETCATGKAPLTLYDQRGRVMLKTSIFPLALALVKTRHPRRRPALAD